MPETAAKRARARRNPAIFKPPLRPVARRDPIEGLRLSARGRTYPIGANVEGDTPWELSIEGAGTVTLPVRSPDDSLLDVLAEEQLIQQEGVRTTIDDVIYVISAIDADGQGLYTLTVEDEVAWRLKQFSSFLSDNRDKTTRFGFIKRFVDEASRPPLARMRYWIPEIDDPQPVRGVVTRKGRPAKRKRGDSGRGLGDAEIEVKGQRATATQRRVIDGCLAEAHELGASKRVLVAVVMTITQESDAGEAMNVQTGNDDVGIYQQGRNWISVEGAKDPAKATHAFLITGPTSWKKVHSGLKHAPGDLETAIKKVQISVGGYAQWQQEATHTVDEWLGGDFGSAGVRTKRFEFTRGERGGQRETSWDAAARLVGDVRGQRWAAGNVFHAASEDELRAAAPSVHIDGDEPWLLSRPAFEWGSGRKVAEVTLGVLADRWGVLPGGIVILDRALGPFAGRWIVKTVGGGRLDSPEAQVVLKRPTQLRAEPAAETTKIGGSSTRRGDSGLLAECQRISDAGGPYDYGGGHGPALSSLRSGQGLDCSSSCSLALRRADMFDGTVAIVSGAFASSWGKPGKGRDFTVWANDGHVWIEGYDDDDGDFAWRFDTSPHGSGPSGPRVRKNARNDQARFTARHWPGR